MVRRVLVGDFKIGPDERNAVNAVLDNSRISEWKHVKEFEKAFSDYIGTKYCVAVSSGTAALITGLLALLYDERYPKAKKGAKVITSPVTYVSTVNALILTGFEPVFVDIDKETFALNMDQVESLVKETPDDYAGILPVHLMGYPNDMERMNSLAEKFSLFVFEDSAQAHGSLHKGKKLGSFGLLSDFSFYIAHNIQAGEMGCVMTDDLELYKIMKQLKANGRLCNCEICTRMEGVCPGAKRFSQYGDYDPRFTFEYISYNFKTNEFAAALGLSQVKKADMIFEKRQNNVKYLNKALNKYNKYFYLPKYDENVSYLAYPIIVRENAPFDRKWIRSELETKGIENRTLFGCLPTQRPVFEKYKSEYESLLPIANYVGANAFYIGCHQYMDKEDLDYIIQAFESILSIFN
nr:DegT/DnrJ/EryC1/StrS family aminotransferase [uncultured Methanolobus sp.]